MLAQSFPIEIIFRVAVRGIEVEFPPDGAVIAILLRVRVSVYDEGAAQFGVIVFVVVGYSGIHEILMLDEGG